MTRTAVFRHDLFLQHDPGFDHVERPERLEVIYRELDSEDVATEYLFPSFSPAAEDLLLLNHTASHVRRIKATAGRKFDILDPDTRTSPHSYEAACLAAGATVEGVRLLHEGEIDNGFALVRPPGHHAEADRAMGFCLFNNIAIGAKYAIERCNRKRIMIVDWDLHHGNGSQHSFYDTDKVFYFSTHQYPYYPGTGALLETGSGKGEGYTLNVPLSGGQDDMGYAGIFNSILLPLIRQFQPELILVSAGFDTYYRDPLGGMAVTTDGFAYMTRSLLLAAKEVCNGHLLLCLEGGYNLGGMKEGVFACLRELSGKSSLSPEKLRQFSQSKAPAGIFRQVQTIANHYWKL